MFMTLFVVFEILSRIMVEIISRKGSFKRFVTRNSLILDTPPYVTLIDHFV